MAKVLAEYVGFDHPKTGDRVVIERGGDTNGKGVPLELLKLWRSCGLVATETEKPVEVEKPKGK